MRPAGELRGSSGAHFAPPPPPLFAGFVARSLLWLTPPFHDYDCGFVSKYQKGATVPTGDTDINGIAGHSFLLTPPTEMRTEAGASTSSESLER